MTVAIPRNIFAEAPILTEGAPVNRDDEVTDEQWALAAQGYRPSMLKDCSCGCNGEYYSHMDILGDQSHYL